MADVTTLPADVGTIRVACADVPPLGTVFFEAEVDGETVSAFAIRTSGGEVRCYVNICPHVPLYGLDFGDGRVVDARDGRIVCANHGARFAPESGQCVLGPCRGAALQAWPCREEDGWLVVAPLPEPDGWPDAVR